MTRTHLLVSGDAARGPQGSGQDRGTNEDGERFVMGPVIKVKLFFHNCLPFFLLFIILLDVGMCGVDDTLFVSWKSVDYPYLLSIATSPSWTKIRDNNPRAKRYTDTSCVLRAGFLLS